jgi:tetratricopeptide (TPR) repeat protein
MEVVLAKTRLVWWLLTAASLASAWQQPPRARAMPTEERPAVQQPADQQDSMRQQAEKELREGIALTSSSQFQQAIPHFLAARGRVANSLALEFNLALCYVGTRRFADAIQILTRMSGGQRSADVKNLLTQAYVGAHHPEAALEQFQQAARLTPKNERLYLLVSQACLDEGLYDAGAHVIDTGLRNLPDSGPLHFQRGLFHAQQDDNDAANREFQLARKLAPNTAVPYIAEAEEALFAGDVQKVIGAAREGIRAGYSHYLLLTMLGEALLRAGATPDTAEFAEVQAVLEKAVAMQPGYSGSHIALGRVYLALGRVPDAIAQMETGRGLDPHNKAVYPPLAAAYQRSGQPEKAKEALAVLAQLNREEAARIRSADGGHAGYVTGKSKQDR